MKRFVGWALLFSWLATPWLWWQSRRPGPRATVLEQVQGGSTRFFTSDARLFICGDANHIGVYDVKRGEQIAIWPRSLHAVETFFGSADNPVLGAVRTREGVEVFDLISGKTVASFAPGPGSPLRIHLAPNGKLAATDHDNQTLRVWDLASGQPVAEFAFPQAGGFYVSFSPDSRRLAVTEAATGRVNIIDLATRELKEWPGSVPRGIMSAVFVGDGRLLGRARIGASDIGLWDLTNDRLLVRCPISSNGFLGSGSYWTINHYPFISLYSLADQIGAKQVAQQILYAGAERRIFDTRTGDMVGCDPSGGVSAIFPDGKTLAAYSREGDCVQLWDVRPGPLVHPLFAWSGLCLAVVLTGWWWRLRRRAPERKDGVNALTAVGPSIAE